MRYVTEFRSGALAQKLAREVASLVEPGRVVKIMEVCGGHTHAIYRHGVEDLVPDEVDFVHGPGLPGLRDPDGPGRRRDRARRAPRGRLHDVRGHAARPREPGLAARGEGARSRCPDGLLAARRAGARPPYPRSADRLLRDRVRNNRAGHGDHVASRPRRGRSANFSVFCNHVTIAPPLRAILESPGLRLDALHRAGSRLDGDRDAGLRLHRRGVREARRRHGLRAARHPPGGGDDRCASSGKAAARSRTSTRASFVATVTRARSPRSRRRWSCATRSSGVASAGSSSSALRLRPELADWDAERSFELPGARIADPKACQCGEVLIGAIKPWECRVFGTACTPERPIGTCMVSSEGACAAYYNYGRLARRRDRMPV